MSPGPGSPPRRPGLEPFIRWSIWLGIFALIVGAVLAWLYPEPRYYSEPRAQKEVQDECPMFKSYSRTC